MLKERGANITCKDKQGWSALHKAAEFGFKAIIEYLLKEGTAINAPTKDGMTPLLVARHNLVMYTS